MNPLRSISLKVFERSLQETGPAYTFARLCTSRHLEDLQVIATVTVMIFVVADVYVYTTPNDPTNLGNHVAFFTGLAAAATAVLSWTYQSGSRRIGAVDLFASEISVICRVCLIVDFAKSSVQQTVGPMQQTASVEISTPQPAESTAKFTSEEHYTPVYDSNLSDLQPLDVEVVSHVTQFYTYRKTMMDYLRRLAATNDGGLRHDLLIQMIYMQFLMYESARLAVADLIEFEPNQAESKINILCSELVLYTFLKKTFERDFRGDRLDLRLDHYRHIVPTLNTKVMLDQHRNWRKAQITAPEMMARYETMCRDLNCAP